MIAPVKIIPHPEMKNRESVDDGSDCCFKGETFSRESTSDKSNHGLFLYTLSEF
jgi:hypothetical protein